MVHIVVTTYLKLLISSKALWQYVPTEDFFGIYQRQIVTDTKPCRTNQSWKTYYQRLRFQQA
ncbi:hypothetical protein [Fischerella thermalis]|uniref:hypothetical protein n=1 Tax=Fischerella thermalis TaxID=372787 RepID=UPI00307CD3FB